jgi:hypothetical protein
MAYLRVFYLAAITLFSGAAFSETDPFPPSVGTNWPRRALRNTLSS